jgi:hypothetical protein
MLYSRCLEWDDFALLLSGMRGTINMNAHNDGTDAYSLTILLETLTLNGIDLRAAPSPQGLGRSPHDSAPMPRWCATILFARALGTAQCSTATVGHPSHKASSLFAGVNVEPFISGIYTGRS